jgi:hypothetical protein
MPRLTPIIEYAIIKPGRSNMITPSQARTERTLSRALCDEEILTAAIKSFSLVLLFTKERRAGIHQPYKYPQPLKGHDVELVAKRTKTQHHLATIINYI